MVVKRRFRAGPAAGSDGFEAREAKVPKPVQANIAVIGAGVGVLTFATGEGCLPSRGPIAVATHNPSLWNWPAASENDNEEFETGLLKRPYMLSGTAQRLP